METYLRCKPNQPIKIEQLEPQQKYRLGMISNIKLRGALTDFTGA